MHPRRHRMRQRQRGDSARVWIRSGSAVTVQRYGVNEYTAYDDLIALGFALPDSAQQWAQRPPATPCRTVERATLPVHDEWWIMLDGRPFFVAGYTSGGTAYGVFADEMPPHDDLL
ncbi:hypothetical protein OHA72_12315 [Dactylosporangium sp. NBC_01737]|uniref:hypothetical protein n=1 Tax=Dactylosporangium sp. NBC_01737 TaxID=2975959 RepID=UPI002E0D8716|nr:hypothetical protein OHA72_12315 [Dactylosporangium sp. NBC_01737]